MNGEPIRILHVVAKMNRAGTETMLMNFYRNIDREKIQFDFAICSDEKGDYEEEIEYLGGKIIRYPRYKGINHLYYVKWWNAFFKNHKEYKIIHGHIGSTAAIYLSIAKKYGIFTIAHSHGTKEPLSLRSVLYTVYSYPTRFVADYFFGCSFDALKARYGDKVAYNKKIACVLNNSIDSEKYAYSVKKRAKIRTELKICENEFVIGTVGRLSSPKNPFKIIEILSCLKNRGEKFRFLWVGVGEMQHLIEKSIAEKGLTNEVIMLGSRNDVPDILQAMDIFIFPSIWEGLGIVAIEAQAAGLPTLCSDNVPREAKITDLCEFLTLEDTDKWADRIVTNKNKSRTVTTKLIKKAKYDIKDTSLWLQNFYLSKI